MSRLTIDISPEQHKSLKALAALEGKTIRQYTLERLFPRGNTERGPAPPTVAQRSTAQPNSSVDAAPGRRALTLDELLDQMAEDALHGGDRRPFRPADAGRTAR